MKQFFLLIRKFTYIYIPKKLQADKDKLPKALRFLPLLGLLLGAIIYIASRWLSIMPPLGAAAALLGLNIVFGGAHNMRDLITVADGMSVAPQYTPQDDKPDNPQNKKELEEKSWRFNAGKAGLTWGLVWLLAIYFLYLWYFSSNSISNIVFLLAPVVCRFLVSWVVFYFYAAPPAWLHRNFSRKDFIVSAILALVCIIPFSRPVLLVAILFAFLGVFIFCSFRQRNIGGLDDACYGAVCAWAEVLFLLTWMTFGRFF